MSKSAAKYIRANVSGRIADLCLDVLYTPAIRKNWKNADVLARFLIDTVANAYQCENSTTFADNGHADMEDAISSYIEANLCDWDQAKFLASSFGKQSAEEITARLNEWRTKNAEFELRRVATQNELVAQQPQSAAEEMQIIFWAANDYVARRNIVEAAHEEALRMNDDAEFNTRKMRLMIQNGAYDAEHAEALAMNDAWHLEQPCAAARNNAHYYELLVAKRQRKGQVSMTQIDLAYEYILNDAIAGDMVKSVDLYHRSILMRDGSWLQLMVSEHNPNIKHGFYVKTQDKLA